MLEWAGLSWALRRHGQRPWLRAVWGLDEGFDIWWEGGNHGVFSEKTGNDSGVSWPP